jgi:putative peptide zinc metalloprotease protein
VFLLGLIHWNVYIYADGIVEPENREMIVARTPGFVTEIRAKPGQDIKRGDVILVAHDDELETTIKQLESQVQREEIARRKAAVVSQAERSIVEQRIIAIQKQLDDAKRRFDELTVRAPIDGNLVAPKLNEMMGKYLQKGEEIAQVATIDRLEVRAIVDQGDAQLATEKQLASDDFPTEVRLVGRPGVVLRAESAFITQGAQPEIRHPALTAIGGGAVAIDPRDSSGLRPQVRQFELRCSLANPDSTYQSGQRAFLRIRIDDKPLAWQWWRKFMQLIQTRQREKSKLID